MKKLVLILATIMAVAVNGVYAQNHRHTDRSNVAVVESIASSNAAALDTISQSDVDHEFGAFMDDNGYNIQHGGDDDGSVAKIAIIAVFGSLSLLFLAPVFIVLIVLYFKHKNTMMKNKIAMAAIEKGVPIPDDTTAKESTKQPTATHPGAAPDSNKALRMEKGVKKVALGAGLGIGGMFINVGILVAIGIAFAIYGIGLICIDQFIDHKND